MLSQIVVNIIIAASLYLLISKSFSIVFFTAKFFDITQAGIISFAAYFAFLFYKQIGFDFWLTVITSILLAASLGVIVEIIFYKYLQKVNADSLVLFITSLGIYIVFQNAISLIWGNSARSINAGEIKVGNEIFGGYITTTQLIAICTSIVLFIGSSLFINNSRTGKKMRAISSNAKLSYIFGIDYKSVLLCSYFIGSALGAVAGLLVAFDTGITPTMGFNLLLSGIVVVIIGGIGSDWGLIGGSLLLAIAQNLIAYYLSSQWMNAIAYVILILFLIWKPLGFSGKRLKKIEI